jgi:hypothetical protein
MRFRTALICAIGLAAIVTAAAASEAPRGAYVSLTTSNAAACARACADDGICMAWSFHRENECQLSAVVAAELDQEALATGYSARAPAALQPRAPVIVAEAAASLPPPLAAASSNETPPAIAPKEDDGLLLGGPSEGDLRLGLH